MCLFRTAYFYCLRGQSVITLVHTAFSATLSRPDAWGVTKGDNLLKQQADATTEDQMEKVFGYKNGTGNAQR